MIDKIISWFKKHDFVSSLATVKVVPKNQIKSKNLNTKVYLNDPTYPNFIKEQLEPRDTVLAMKAMGEKGGGYPLGSVQQQALALKLMINDALIYMMEKSPKKINKWAAVQSLMLMPRAGKDINAYYDRSSLRFFFFGDSVLQKNVFTCNSRSVVTHEFGHAFLDILRPDWWDVQAIEIWAFHEAFGDITALLNSLQFDELINYAIDETQGNLLKSNILTRLAAEMGTSLYNLTKVKTGELPNCLRDMSHVFEYTEPEQLPENGRSDQLLSESHSFSRVFSGAIWEIIVKIAIAQGSNLNDGLKTSRDIVAHYLLTAVVNAPTTIRLFDAIAQQMMHVDLDNGGKYQSIIKEVFTNRNILRQNVMIQGDVDLEMFLKDMQEPHEIQIHGNSKIVKTLANTTMKLVDKLGPVSTLDNNPLMVLEITVANQSAYYFDNDKLVSMSEPHDAEVVDAAYNCLRILNNENLVGKHSTALFENKYGKLMRKQIVCTCGKPNYCDPNAPEFGKPWKPANNSGCTSCKSNCLPRSCDCNKPKEKLQPKIGCYTTMRSGSTTTYKFGSSASRKTC